MCLGLPGHRGTGCRRGTRWGWRVRCGNAWFLGEVLEGLYGHSQQRHPGAPRDECVQAAFAPGAAQEQPSKKFFGIKHSCTPLG